MSRTRAPSRTPRRSKSAVSTGSGHRLAEVRLEEHAVLLDGPERGLAPGEPAERTLTARVADARAQVGVAERPPERLRQRVRVAGRHDPAGLPVGADDLGYRAARRADDRDAARHRLDGRQ